LLGAALWAASIGAAGMGLEALLKSITGRGILLGACIIMVGIALAYAWRRIRKKTSPSATAARKC
jgi:hypothetical protein